MPAVPQPDRQALPTSPTSLPRRSRSAASLVELLDRFVDLRSTTSCSRQAALISETSSAVFRMSGTRRVSISPACCAAFTVSPETARFRPPPLATFGQLAHFRGHHREAPCRVRRRGSFHCRVEGEQIGLTRDLLHDRDLLCDRPHRNHGLVDRIAADFGILGRLAGDLLGLRRCRRSA